jgi:peptidoglycan hydrolase CwlO-like protein
VSTPSADGRDIDPTSTHHVVMTAIVWTLVGLMAASLAVLSTALFAMLGRFDSLDTRIDGVNARFDGVNARFDSVNARIDNVDGRFDNVDGRFDNVNARFDSTNDRIDGLGAQIRADLLGFDERLRSVGG